MSDVLDDLDSLKDKDPSHERGFNLLRRVDKFIIAIYIVFVLFKLMSWPFAGIILIVDMLLMFLAYLIGWPIVIGRRLNKMSNIYPRVVSVCFAFSGVVLLFSKLSWPGAREIATVFFPIAIVLAVLGIYAYVVGNEFIEKKLLHWSLARLAATLYILF